MQNSDVGWPQFAWKLVDMREEKDRICLLYDHNIIESECHVIMSCPVYNELRGELFTHAAQFEPNFNNLNDDKKIVFLFSATDMFLYCQDPL